MSVPIRIAPDGLHGCKETHARMPLGAERLPCALDEGLITGAEMTEASFGTWPLPPFPILSPLPGPYVQCCGPSMHYPFLLLHLHTGWSFCLRHFCKFCVLQSSDWGASSRKPTLVITSFTCSCPPPHARSLLS